MLSKRVYKILKFLESQKDWVIRLETDFSEDDFEGLESEGLVSKNLKSILDETKTYTVDYRVTYKITAKGKDALELHDLEEARYAEARKISKSSRRWAIIAAAIGFIGIIVSILLALLV